MNALTTDRDGEAGGSVLPPEAAGALSLAARRRRKAEHWTWSWSGRIRKKDHYYKHLSKAQKLESRAARLASRNR